MAICYLGIGSNLQDRRRHIKLAIQKLKKLKDTKVIKVSRLYETNPVGGPAGQGKFLNAALKIKTALPPLNLLKSIQRIEQELGRIKTLRYGPRTIDLDILFYGKRVIRRRELKIPHPRVFQRQFVMRPLLEAL
jgi:2-amino-4-hydroxy-6-hydroxymethyldihydropteridine diphosphokinase